MDRKTISREDAAWLTGIIEGEGSFFFRAQSSTDGFFRSRRPCITVTNSDYVLIKRVSELWYDLGIKFYYKLKKTKADRLSMSIESIGDGNCQKLIALIRPYLISKADQADLMMEYIFWRKEQRTTLLREQGGGYQGFKSLPEDAKFAYRRDTEKFHERLRAMRRNCIDPQRLQRKASEPLRYR